MNATQTVALEIFKLFKEKQKEDPSIDESEFARKCFLEYIRVFNEVDSWNK